MIRSIIVCGIALLFTSAAQAKCDLFQNCYNSNGSGYTGSNSRTGSQWNAQSYGSQTYGTDSRGNSWSYDRNTGIYNNYGTGETRVRGRQF